MSAALTPPFLVAALVVCVAGAAKLRSPQVAGDALRALGLPGGTSLVRGLAAAELGLGVVCALHPTRGTAAVLTAAYVTFTGVAAALVGRRAGCGCFGEADTPVARAHVAANAVLAAVVAAAVFAPPHGLGWLAGRPAGRGVALAVGVAGAAYAVVLLYTAVPRAWASWSGE